MNTENMVWYSSPAGKWEDALPIGNGRMGGMVYGGVKEDQIHLNDDTLYGGAPMQRVNPAARKTLDAVRELLRQGRLDEGRRRVWWPRRATRGRICRYARYSCALRGAAK